MGKNANDFYETPQLLADAHVKAIVPNQALKTVLDAGAGMGRYGRALYQYAPDTIRFGIELIENEMVENHKPYYDRWIVGSYFDFQPVSPFDYIIGNPPFSLAQEFIEKSLDILQPTGVLSFLLPTSFLGSQKRFDFWQRYTPRSIFMLTPRPGFGVGNDRIEYVLVQWNKEQVGSTKFRWLKWR